MSRRFPCPQCAKEMLLERMHEGFDVPCPACGHRFAVPMGFVAEAEAAAPPPPSPPAPPPAVGAVASPGASAGSPSGPARPSYDVPPPRRPQGGDDGTLALVLGIVGLVVCPFVLGPVAWYLGHQIRARAKAEGVDPPGNATAGWVLGIVGTVLGILGCALYAVFFGVMASQMK